VTVLDRIHRTTNRIIGLSTPREWRGGSYDCPYCFSKYALEQGRNSEIADARDLFCTTNIMSQMKLYSVFLTRIEKNSLIGLNSNSVGKWTNQNFLIISIRILVEITRILINIIILVKIRILIDFTKNVVSTRIPIIFQLEF